jgi:putative endonuclease
VAAAFLRRHGYKVLTRNYQVVDGEIDLVCRHGNVLAFVEVRTRGGDSFGRPAESIDARKEEALRRAAQSYLKLLDRDDITYRFDAVEVRLQSGEIPDCTLIENLFA